MGGGGGGFKINGRLEDFKNIIYFLLGRKFQSWQRHSKALSQMDIAEERVQPLGHSCTTNNIISPGHCKNLYTETKHRHRLNGMSYRFKSLDWIGQQGLLILLLRVPRSPKWHRFEEGEKDIIYTRHLCTNFGIHYCTTSLYVCHPWPVLHPRKLMNSVDVVIAVPLLQWIP